VIEYDAKIVHAEGGKYGVRVRIDPS